MTRSLTAIAFVLSTFAGIARADWQDELTHAPGAFPPLAQMKAHYRFGWSMFTAAEADFDIARPKKELIRLAVTTRSIGVVRSMWRMNAEHVSTISATTLLPISMVQTEVYKDETAKTKVDYSPIGITRLRETTPPGKDPPKTKRFDYPEIFDLHGGVQFIRSQKLATGDSYKIVVYPSKAPYLAEVEVEGRQKLKLATHAYNAIKLNLKLSRIADSDMSLHPHEKFKSASIWLSDDADRLLLRIEAEIAVGNVWAELEKVDLKPH
jgi:hypothetical protein